MVPLTPRARIGLIVVLAPIACAAGCQRAEAVKREPPVPTVTVVKAETRDVPIVARSIGTTRALQEVTIRARVSGFLQEMLFKEGANVEKGQLLLVIDEAPYRAARDAAKAQVAQAEAELQAARDSKAVAVAQAQLLVSQAKQFYAQVQESRARGLLQRTAMTREEYDEQKSALQSADADVQARSADLEQAKVSFTSSILLAQAALDKAKADLLNADLDLSYCRMSSPIAGRIGELQVKVGNYVSKGVDGTSLASVQQLDPMGVDFRPSSRYLETITGMVDEGLTTRLLVQGDRPYPHDGKLEFLDNRVDPTTSTFLLRASVPNPREVLLPGEYVKTLSEIGTYEKAVVVPEGAVIEGQAGPTVFVVNDQGEVTRVAVHPIDTYQGLRVIDDGLEPGQRVVVEGLQLIRPGIKVKVVEKALDDAVRTPGEDTRAGGSSSRARKLQSPIAVPRKGNGNGNGNAKAKAAGAGPKAGPTAPPPKADAPKAAP
jgi:multidrug efflux pump subunit AcrA (membrane-fusion protein)